VHGSPRSTASHFNLLELQGLQANAARFLLGLFARCEGSPFVDEFAMEPSFLFIVCLRASGVKALGFFGCEASNARRIPARYPTF